MDNDEQRDSAEEAYNKGLLADALEADDELLSEAEQIADSIVNGNLSDARAALKNGSPALVLDVVFALSYRGGDLNHYSNLVRVRTLVSSLHRN